MRNRLGDEFDNLHHKVDWIQKYLVAKRRRYQLMRPAAHALDFYVIEQANKKNADRQTQRG